MVGLLLGSVVSSEDGLLLGSVVGSKDGTAVCADGAADGTGEGIEVVNVGLMQLFPSPGEPRLGQLPYAPLYKECQFSSVQFKQKLFTSICSCRHLSPRRKHCRIRGTRQ